MAGVHKTIALYAIRRVDCLRHCPEADGQGQTGLCLKDGDG